MEVGTLHLFFAIDAKVKFPPDGGTDPSQLHVE